MNMYKPEKYVNKIYVMIFYIMNETYNKFGIMGAYTDNKKIDVIKIKKLCHWVISVGSLKLLALNIKLCK